MTNSDFLSCGLAPFSCVGSHPGSHMTFSCYVSRGSSGLWQFLGLSLFLMTLTVLRITGQIFCGMFLYWDLSAVFLVIRLRDHRDKMRFSSHHLRAHAVNMADHCDVNLEHLAGVSVSVSFPFFLFPYCPLRGRVTVQSSQLRSGEFLCATSS